jgi:hypothetical protein
VLGADDIVAVPLWAGHSNFMPRSGRGGSEVAHRREIDLICTLFRFHQPHLCISVGVGFGVDERRSWFKDKSKLEMLARDDDLEDNMELFEQEEMLPGSPEILFWWFLKAWFQWFEECPNSGLEELPMKCQDKPLVDLA